MIGDNLGQLVQSNNSFPTESQFRYSVYALRYEILCIVAHISHLYTLLAQAPARKFDLFPILTNSKTLLCHMFAARHFNVGWKAIKSG
jgi:hypothetical protein